MMGKMKSAVVLIAALMLLAGMASAAETAADTVTVNCDVPATVTLELTGDKQIDMGSLEPNGGTNSDGVHILQEGTIKVQSNFDIDVGVKDTALSGFMSDGTNSLFNPLTISVDGTTYTNVGPYDALNNPSTPYNLLTPLSGEWNTVEEQSIYYRQHVLWVDTPSEDYTMNVEFKAAGSLP